MFQTDSHFVRRLARHNSISLHSVAGFRSAAKSCRIFEIFARCSRKRSVRIGLRSANHTLFRWYRTVRHILFSRFLPSFGNYDILRSGCAGGTWSSSPTLPKKKYIDLLIKGSGGKRVLVTLGPLTNGQIWYHLIDTFMRNNFGKGYFMHIPFTFREKSKKM